MGRTLTAAKSKKNGIWRYRRTLVDVEMLDRANPQLALKKFCLSGKPKIIYCDILIVGGGLGGVSAALAACSSGKKVCLLEESSWLGGQISSQAVSALDENKLVESSGASLSYKDLKERIRSHYLNLGAVAGKARFEKLLDPGNCWVSRLAFEPKVAVKVLTELASPHMEKKLLSLHMRSAAVGVYLKSGKIERVQALDLDTGEIKELRCRFCLDATELGDIIALAGISYASGAESKTQTGEEHAPSKANPENVQDYTYPFILEFCPQEKHLIKKPESYDKFNSMGKFSLLAYGMFEDRKLPQPDGSQRHLLPFWEYRRLIARENFPAGPFKSDLAMINWESNDLSGKNIIDKEPEEMAANLALAKDLSLGFLYWLQNEADRDDGGKGYPEFKLRLDLSGSFDGLSKYPYIRESRRIIARRTICEEDISEKGNAGARARFFADSVGIGHYPIDIHGEKEDGQAQATRPFQIPASALVQGAVGNFLPACKNIGTTHIANGAYRLHPIEWSIGEAAGLMASLILQRKTSVLRFWKNKAAVSELQEMLLARGAPLIWFSDLCPGDPGFLEIQYLALKGLIEIDEACLEFGPEETLKLGELAFSLARVLRLEIVSEGGGQGQSTKLYEAAIAVCREQGLLPASLKAGLEHGVSVELLKQISKGELIKAPNLCRLQLADLEAAGRLVSRRDFAVWLYRLHVLLRGKGCPRNPASKLNESDFSRAR